MADIFVSYSRKDRNRAKAIALALGRHGWSVWWDSEIPVGRSWDTVLEEEFEKARAVVVLWSPSSAASDWVRNEAREAKVRSILIPVLIEPANLPMEFRHIRTADLTQWQAGELSDEFEKLIAGLRRLLPTRAPKRIVILRHAEKPGAPDAPDDPSNPNLSRAGLQRAQILAELIREKFGDPDFLFAAMSSTSSQRPVQTLEPLTKKLGVTSAMFIVAYPNSNYGELARDLLSQQKYVDKLLVVCWHHSTIPELGLALGLTRDQIVTAPEIEEKHGELKWIATVFDRFWILDFQSAPAVQFHSVPQGLSDD